MEENTVTELNDTLVGSKNQYHHQIETHFLESLKTSTPKIQDFKGYVDADDELLMMAKKLIVSSKYLSDVQPDRIKFFYSSKPKKRGGNYEIFNLLLRNEIEKSIEESYDYILTVYYQAWKDLTPIQKVISLDKALCGIDFGKGEEVKLGKASPDCSEFKTNMKQYGATEVMDTSEVLHLICEKIIQDTKDAKAAERETKKANKNK